MLLAHDLVEGAGAETGCQGRLALEAAVGGVGEEAQRVPSLEPVPGLGGPGRPGGTTTRMPSSARAAAGSGVGAPVNRSAPDWVLGYAMTSRMFSSPARIATSRSTPTANPAWGGAP